jgi:hypothetical protein
MDKVLPWLVEPIMTGVLLIARWLRVIFDPGAWWGTGATSLPPREES